MNIVSDEITLGNNANISQFQGVTMGGVKVQDFRGATPNAFEGFISF